MKPCIVLAMALAQPAAVDLHGDALPPGGIARLGTARFRAPMDLRGLVFSPDGKRLAARTAAGLQIWDAATGTPVLHRNGLEYQVETFAFIAGAKYVVASVPVGLDIWEAETGKPVRQIRRLGVRDALLYGDPKGNLFAFVGNGGVWLADVQNKDAPRLLQQVYDPSVYAAWSRDGTRLAVASDQHITLWKVAPDKQLHRFEVAGCVTRLAFGAGDKTLAVVTGKGTLLVDPATGKLLKELKPPVKNCVALWFSDDGNRVTVAGRDGNTLVRVWDTATGKVVHEFERDYEPRVVAFAPDGKTVAMSYRENRVGLWDVATGKPADRAEGHGSVVHHIAYLGDGTEIATATSDGEARVWDAATGRQVRVSNKSRSYVYGAHRCFAPDANVMVSVEADGRLGLWNLQTAGLQCLAVPARDTFALGDVSAGGGTVVLRTEAAVLVWDIGAKKLRLRCPCDGQPRQAVLSPDEGLLLIRDDEELQLWDLGRGRPAWALGGFFNSILGFTAESRQVVVMNNQGELNWLDAETGTTAGSTPIQESLLKRAAFSSDGRWMTTAHAGGMVCLWEARSHCCVWKFVASPHPDVDARQIRGLAFAPDQRHLAVAVEDTSVLIYDLDALVPDVAARVQGLTAAKRDALWTALAGGSGEDAFVAAALLAATPAQTVAELRSRLAAVPVVTPARLDQLLADLDAPAFAKREAAAKALLEAGDIAESGLRQLLRDTPTLEMRRRGELLLQKLAERYTRFPSRAMFAERAVEVLERIGTPEARALLERLARGDPRAAQTRQARRALAHLANHG